MTEPVTQPHRVDHDVVGPAAARKVLDNERYAGPGAHRALRFFAHLLFFRHPRLASEALHQYHDKFALAEWVVSQAGMAHIIVLEALGLKRSAAVFGHGREHPLEGGRVLIDSYHCSRYNTQTRRLTPAMFENVLQRARELSG